MARRLTSTDGFIDDADTVQPRVTIAIDGGLRLSAAERAICDELVAPFVDDFVLAVRNFYRGLSLLGLKLKPLTTVSANEENPMQ
jgi:hypothetical protein